MTEKNLKNREDEKESQAIDGKRRGLIRKLAYAPPALIALSFASNTRQARGDLPDPPSAPNTNSEDPLEELKAND